MEKLDKKILEDTHERLQEVELELTEAKEFSHLSHDAFEQLQAQINEIRDLLMTAVDKLGIELPDRKPDERGYG